MTMKESPGCNKTKELLDERHKTVIKEMQLRKEFCHNCDYCNEQFIDLDECITHQKVCPKRPISKFY